MLANQPRIISWNTTNECNLRCLHCYMDAKVEKGREELNTLQGKKLAEEIAEVNDRCILILSGGEPLVREDIFEIAEHADSLGLRVVMGTNGTMIDPEVAGKLKDAGIARVAISIDGCDELTHDNLRKVPGAFEATLAGANACREVGLEFQINTTITRENYGRIQEIVNLAKDLGAVEFHPFFLVPTGRGKDLEDIKPRQYEQMLKSLLEREKAFGIKIKPTCAPMYMRISREIGGDAPARYSRGCLAGTAYCRISPEGGVFPCPYLPIEVGNVKNQSFGEIWSNAPLFKELRDFDTLKGKCGICEHKDICGGCRARAYGISGDPFAAEPWCTYVPKKKGEG